MFKIVSEDQLDLEISSSYRPMAIESGIMLLPFGDLGDREFETLAYLLVKQEIKDSIHPNISSIALMQGVAERGRDCVLYEDGAICGLIQCKKYNARLTRPQTIKEIIKFILFSIIDNSILPDPEDFEYKLYVSNDFTEPTIALLHSFNTEIETEISNGKIQDYINSVIQDYESFKDLKETPPISKVIDLLKQIKVSGSNAIDLSSRVSKCGSLLSTFFKVTSVVDLQSSDKQIRKALDDYGLKLLTDADLKVLQDRIKKTKEEDRINLGFIDFFGYNTEFFKFLKGEPFKEIITKTADLKTTLNKYLIDYMNRKIHESIYKEITVKLLNNGLIHPFSVGIAAPYLFSRLSIKLLSSNFPKSILKKLSPEAEESKDDLISKISKTLYQTSEQVMNGDYSQLTGTKSEIDYKIQIFDHLHTGFTNIDDAVATFNEDIKRIQPVLDKIEDLISSIFADEKTIIIKDGSFLDSKDELHMMVKTMNKIE